MYYRRPANCPTVCSMSVIFKYGQSCLIINSKQKCFEHSEAVRKTALISIQTAHTLSNVKAEELDAKELFIQQVDSIALLDHISYELACLCRYKRKLKFNCAYISTDDGQPSKFLFGDDL